MKKVLLLSVLLLAGCNPPNNFDTERSIEVAKGACNHLGAELQNLRYLPVGDVALEATCANPNTGEMFKLQTTPVYR